MSRVNDPVFYDVPITVSGGTGQTVLLGSSWTNRIALTAPAAAIFNLNIRDKDDKPLGGGSGLVNDQVLVDRMPLKESTTFKITGPDGSYSLRVWEDRTIT